MRLIVYLTLAALPLTFAAVAGAALVYGALYLVRCVNIARRHGA